MKLIAIVLGSVFAAGAITMALTYLIALWAVRNI